MTTGQFLGQGEDSVVDVLRRLVGVPVLERDAVGNVDLRLAAQGDNDVDGAQDVGVDGLGTSLPMSTPTSARACADNALTFSPGSIPAECATTRPPAAFRMSPAAICDLPLLRTHTNNTDGVIAGPGRRERLRSAR